MAVAIARDMLRSILVVLALIASAFCPAVAGGAARSPGEQCQAAIAEAEHAQGIPPHLLAAVGRVESGREGGAANRWTPWPWTIDVNGQGAFFPTKEMAIAAVRLLNAQGITSIDVGCLQINLSYHGGAFESLQQAFDPTLNVAYGARFLRALFRQTGDWGAAVGRYHSMTTTLATDYRRKVMAAWSGGAIKGTWRDPLRDLARAWAATLDASPATSSPVWLAPTTWSGSGSGTRATALTVDCMPAGRRGNLCGRHRSGPADGDFMASQ